MASKKKNIQVFQPAFSNWVIQRRQKLNLSPAHLRQKLNDQLSERTLKYVEGARKETFSEYTLTILAQGLDLSYAELLKQIEEINSGSSANALRPRRAHLANKLSIKRVNLFLLIASCIAILIFVTGGFNGLFNQINQITGFNIAGFGGASPALQGALIDADYPQIIFVHDKKNKLWQKKLDTKIIKVDVVDLDQNGSREVIAATYRENYWDWGEHPGWLLVWNEKGELLTEQNMLKTSIYPAKESHCAIEGFEIVDLDRDGRLEIVAMIRGLEYYPSRLAILHYENFHFKEAATYWNPGYIVRLLIDDIDRNGFSEIICIAVNNDLKRLPELAFKENMQTLFMLSGRSVFGQAPPYLGEAEKGSQVWYQYLTPPISDRASVIMGLSVTREVEKLILVKLNDGCFFYLNYAGEIVDEFYGDSCRGEAEMHLIPNDQVFTNVYDHSESP